MSDNGKHRHQIIPPDASTFQKPEEVASDFLAKFRAESEETRKLILKDILATDTLARIGVTNYRELFLEYTALERGVVFSRVDPPSPSCPHCGCINAVLVEEKENLYLCKECSKKFAPNKDTVSWKAKVSLLTYAKLLHCLLNYETVARTMEVCDISANTYYRMRNHIYYLISVYLENLTLCGEIQVDETYLNISYKGTNLKKSPFDDEDELYPQSYKPRDSRNRGGSYAKSEVNSNKICVFCAVDSRGFVYSSYAGIGVPSVRALRKNVATSKFLHIVPDTNCFPYPLKEARKDSIEPGSRSLLIFDGSNVLSKFADKVLQMDSYSRVYRRNGIQTKAPASFKHLNTQRVNYVHRRLREHIRRSGSGSSRYIKGTLLLFDFMMNTGAPHNQAAIDALLRLLVVPGLRQSNTFYDNYFSLPNHLFEWSSDDNVLSKLYYPKVRSYWLYDRYKHPERYPGTETPTLEQIQDDCGLSLPTIRSTYRDFKAAGYHERVILHFNRAHFPHLVDENMTIKRASAPSDDIDAAALEIFDRRAVERTKPYRLRKSLATICKEVNKEYNSHYLASGYHHVLSKILSQGLREEPADMNITDKYLDGFPVSETSFFLLEQYDALVDEALLSNKEPIGTRKAYDLLAEKFPNYKRSSIVQMVSTARRYLRKADEINQSPACHDTVQAHLVEIYEDYSQYRRTHWVDKTQELEVFWKDICQRYNFNVSVEWLRTQMRRMSNEAKINGGHPLPDYLPYPRKNAPSDSGLRVVALCQKIMEQRKKRNLPPLFRKEMISTIKKKIPELSESTIGTYLSESHISFPAAVHKRPGMESPENELRALKAYDKMCQESAIKGEKPPSITAAAEAIHEKELSNLTPKTIRMYISRGVKRREKAEAELNSKAQNFETGI